MYDAVRVDEFIFDGAALESAYTALDVTATEGESEYTTEALRALLRYFADWGPARDQTFGAHAADTLSRLGEDDRQDLYHRFSRELSKYLDTRYEGEQEVTEEEFRRFLSVLAEEPASVAFADHLLTTVWEFANDLREIDPQSGSVADASELLERLRALPDEYLEAGHSRYRGSSKVNRIRYGVFDAIISERSYDIDTLEADIREENEKFDSNIVQNWRNYTILGQPYFDFFRPRIDACLETLAEVVRSRLDLTDHSLHTVHFTEPQSYLSDFAWLAIYPEEEAGDQRHHYQLYVGLYGDRLRAGLHVGSEIRSEGWKDVRDIETYRDPERISIDELLDQLQSVRQSYLELNDLVEPPEPPEKPPRAETIERQLEARNQVVLYGPPGTGKTYEAKRFAEWWIHDRTGRERTDDHMTVSTFHPSYSYEDFIEGLTAEATDGGVVYEVEDGTFKRVAEDAREAYERARRNDEEPEPYVLIVDEINRGNLAEIFGETITLLESDKRIDAANETEIRLAHSDEPFAVPPNLYLIGTMNTADQSISLVDAALRRRFRFLHFDPDYRVLRDEYDFAGTDAVHDAAAGDADQFDALVAASILALETLNSRIVTAPNVGKGKQVGHATLLGLETVQDVVDAWQFDILPLLEEYYFGQFERLQRDVFDNGNTLFNPDAKRIRDFGPRELYEALTDLADLEAGSVSFDEDDTSSGSTRRQWTEGEFFDQVGNRLTPDETAVVRELYDFAETLGRTGFGDGSKHGSFMCYHDDVNERVGLFKVSSDGEISVRTSWLAGRDDTRGLTPQAIRELTRKLEDLDGAEFEQAGEVERAITAFPASALVDEADRDRFEDAIESFVDQCRSNASELTYEAAADE